MPHAVQCPRCNGAVSVPDQAAGERVKCPHCEQSFVAPGFAATKNDDDDWLTLESDPDFAQLDNVGGGRAGDQMSSNDDPLAFDDASEQERDAGNKAGDDVDEVEQIDEVEAIDDADEFDISGPESPLRNKQTPNDGGKSGRKLTPEEEALLAEFTTDLDEFTSQEETPPPPLDPSDPFADLPPAGDQPKAASPLVSAGSKQSPSSPPAAEAEEYESEYRVKCLICGSVVYAKASQAGSTVKCSDCYSPIKVPAAPRKKKKNEFDIEHAETFGLENREVKPRRDPFQKSAQELLAEASRVDEKKQGPLYDDVPSVKEWAKNVFGIFLDPAVVVHWLGLSLMAAIPTYIALSFDNPVLIIGLMVAGLFLGAIVVSCGFAILQSVANEEDAVSEWPVFDPMAWFGQLFVALAAAFVAAMPAWLASTFVFGPSLTSAAITMISIYVLFPFVVLSMLDMESAFVPFSPEVARSVTKCEEAWGGFYFSSGVLFVGLFLLYTLTSSTGGATAAVIAITVTIGLTFVYFAMIGRLAYAIGQSVNAPPMKNDIDREQRPRPRDTSV